jgi:release factor glutamine methyltransferase
MDVIPVVYPESDDTYLLADALSKDFNTILVLGEIGLITVEVGPGGGYVSKTFMDLCAKAKKPVFHLGLDVNMRAASETRAVCGNVSQIDCVNIDMFEGIRRDVHPDVIFCNPPYVPSSPINRARDIRASYAGGERGREFIDAFLPVVAERLAPGGVFYFLLEKRNDIEEVLDIAKSQYGFESTFILDRKIRGEHLYVYRFTSPLS